MNFRFQYKNSLRKLFSGCHYFCSLHFSAANELIQKCTKGKESFFTSEQFGCVYVINPNVANQISCCIAKEYAGGYLLESNPGPGILSSSFLQKGIKHLRVFERKKEFISLLKNLATSSPSLEVVELDFMLLPSVEYRKTLESSDLSTYVRDFFGKTFNGIPELPWENGTPFQIFSVISNKKSQKFLRYLLAALPNKSTIFSFGRCDFFFLISETEYMSMKALPRENYSLYRWSTVLYNIFFDIKFLQKFSSTSKDFLFCKKTTKKIARNKYFYLIKLTPKSDIPMTPEKLQDFVFFVRSHLAKRSDLVIRSIEQWIPYCGPRLIKEGMSVFTKFGDLSPKEILCLFQCLSSWPEYQNCNLRAYANKFNKKFLEEENLVQ